MMMYSRFMIMLTLVSMIGLALPSDPQRKIAKGSKKNPPLLFRQDVPVSVVVPEAMSMQKLEDTVTETVLDILEELQKTDNDRRKLAVFRHRTTVQTTDTAPTECSEKYEGVVCFAATVSIASNEDLGDVISKLRDLLGKVIHGRNGAVVTTSNNKTGSPLPYVKITNKTPYEADQGVVNYATWFCSDDVYNVASGQTWTASSRGACLVRKIEASLALSSNGDHLKCQIYSTKVATTYSEFYILMYNDDKHGDKCCVLSSHEYEEYPKCYFMWLD